MCTLNLSNYKQKNNSNNNYPHVSHYYPAANKSI